MASRFRPISYQEFKGWMAEIGFQEVEVPGTFEYVFERPIHCKRAADRLDRFKIQIMSSVSMVTQVTRENGADAIRVALLDTVLGKPVTTWTVHRTQNAHDNVVQRARDAWGYVSEHPEYHCSCGALFVERHGRNGSFMGCSAYPTCKEKRAIS